MTETKWLEIRDRATCIPALAISITGDNSPIARHAGFGENRYIQLIHLTGGRTSYDPFDWGDRTMHTAHLFLEEQWHTVCCGDVVDVQFILGETDSPVDSDIRRK